MPGTTNNQAFSQLIGNSPALEAVIRTAQIAAAADVHILIEGDTGTGKELIAKAIQESGVRIDKPFVILNCAALPNELTESLLFGHEKGAFTGATERKDGYVQRAHQGTLFLDEIGELPLTLQAKLLRFLENGECQRVGSHELEIVNVRVIAATHRNLLTMIDESLFRQDLFYRLSVVTIRMPSLKERRKDITKLSQYFLKQAAVRNNNQPTSFNSNTLSVLKNYRWPGNIRELKNVCEYVSAMTPGENIDSRNLPMELRLVSGNSSTGFILPEGGIDMEALEVDFINQALEQTDGNKSKAARLLGLSRDAFLYRLKKHDL